jgi:hypothetical protein
LLLSPRGSVRALARLRGQVLGAAREIERLRARRGAKSGVPA